MINYVFFQVEGDNSFMKVLYLGQMVRRIILAENDPTWIDNRDYYGNKRIELAGSFLALMFEDLFKHLNHDLKVIISCILNYRTFCIIQHNHFLNFLKYDAGV